MILNPKKYFLFILVLILSISYFTSCEDDYLVINAFEAEGTNINYETGNSTDSLTVAVVSMKCSRDKDENIMKISSFVNEIVSSDPGIDLICFGETITGYYGGTPEYTFSIAENIPGDFTDSISSYSRKNSIYISTGMAERSGDTLYNSLVLFDPAGDILSIHRKNYLTPEDIEAGYSSSATSHTANVNGFKCGLMICADVNSEKLTTNYINEKTEVILSAFASPIGMPNFNIISRRMSAWQIFPNRYGNEDGNDYSGLIYISDPAGNLVKYNTGCESFIKHTIVK